MEKDSEGSSNVPYRAGAKHFDAFRETLHEFSREELIILLDEAMHARIVKLADTYSVPGVSSEDCRQASLDLSLVMMAREGLQDPAERAPHDPNALPGWFGYGQKAVESYVEQNPVAKEALEKTRFLGQGKQAQYIFCEMASASVTPWGYYEEEEFANGVVAEKIYAQLL